MPQQVRAVVVDPSLPERLAIREVGLRDPDRDEVGVRVTAVSLNRGEPGARCNPPRRAGAPAGISPASSRPLLPTAAAPRRARASSASCPRAPGPSG